LDVLTHPTVIKAAVLFRGKRGLRDENPPETSISVEYSIGFPDCQPGNPTIPMTSVLLDASEVLWDTRKLEETGRSVARIAQHVTGRTKTIGFRLPAFTSACLAHEASPKTLPAAPGGQVAVGIARADRARLPRRLDQLISDQAICSIAALPHVELEPYDGYL